jgi:transcriptional regulator with PAS, ATPase and Fis domain
LAADGGTLHLDEIGNASAKVQQALLRALSVRRIRPIGSDDEIEFDARVIAATNVNLKEKVQSGEFREDLFYRLQVLTIETPPLRNAWRTSRPWPDTSSDWPPDSRARGRCT